MTIGIKTEEKAKAEFKAAFQAAQKQHSFKPKTGVYFTSLEAARKFLTKNRLELLHVIKAKSPKSIFELAKFTNRNSPSVLNDIKLLAKHGLVKLNKTMESPKYLLKIKVNYDAINLQIGL